MPIHQLSQLLRLQQHLLPSPLFLIAPGFLFAGRVFLCLGLLSRLLLSQLGDEISVVRNRLRPIARRRLRRLLDSFHFFLELARLLENAGVLSQRLHRVWIQIAVGHGIF